MEQLFLNGKESAISNNVMDLDTHDNKKFDKDAFRPDKNGLKFLEGGLEGIKESRLTSEAPVGPRNASGARQVRGPVFGRPSPREDISKGSGLL